MENIKNCFRNVAMAGTLLLAVGAAGLATYFVATTPSDRIYDGLQRAVSPKRYEERKRIERAEFQRLFNKEVFKSLDELKEQRAFEPVLTELNDSNFNEGDN